LAPCECIFVTPMDMITNCWFWMPSTRTSMPQITLYTVKGTDSDVSFSRHGWGCTPDPAEAVKYLSAAASNAASVEDLALQAGLKKGGAAKGELVLAIFELANCFRHGWGVQVDKLAAKQVRPLEGVDRGEAWSSLTDHWGSTTRQPRTWAILVS
jgi:hypothetical protein